MFGLTDRGWEREGGPLQSEIRRTFAGVLTAATDLDPDLSIDYLEEFPEQQITRLRFYAPGATAWYSTTACSAVDLDPITASEVIREIEEICQ